VKITKRQLKRIIREERTRLQCEYGNPAAAGMRAARHEGQVDAGWIAEQINNTAHSLEQLHMDAGPALVQQDHASLVNDLEKLMNDAFQLALAFKGLSGNSGRY